jgi:predicted dehydrogenase
MSRPAVRLGVVGAGNMGRNHLRTLQWLKGADLVGLVDPDELTASRAAELYGCRPFSSVEALAHEVDAMIVAAPSSQHAEIAIPLLTQGVSCLVEKPLATTEADCLAMIAAARESGARLLVGHVERFNPVIEHLVQLLQGSRIYAVDVRRMSSVSGRITDVDVVSDLMVHDLDIVRALVGMTPSRIRAVGVRAESSAHVDYAAASLVFPNGEIATVTSSRITQNKIRHYQVTSDIGSITADLVGRELLIHRQSRLEPITVGSAEFTLDLSIDRVFVRNAEPLFVELSHFLDVVAGEKEPLVSGEDALASMRMVWAVQGSLAIE